MTYKEWQDWWTKRASTYFTDKIWQFSQPKLITRLNIQPEDCLLEIGFGYGRELSQFCLLSKNVYGVELTDWACSNVAIELYERDIKNLPNLTVYNGLMLPFSGESMDHIYSCFVMQHLNREHAKKLIKESLRVLKIDGNILFEFFGDPEYYNAGENVFSGIDGEGGMFNNAFLQQELFEIIESCGGKIRWIETQKITANWGNYWACFTKAN